MPAFARTNMDTQKKCMHATQPDTASLKPIKPLRQVRQSRYPLPPPFSPPARSLDLRILPALLVPSPLPPLNGEQNIGHVSSTPARPPLAPAAPPAHADCCACAYTCIVPPLKSHVDPAAVHGSSSSSSKNPQ
ncbi:hypothetical protein GQ53DRAFT_351062 [Thozetella sp. PMI_491]|nr:hypothetical protein GQ53DRAFT_351062 [Thozetella sp. PMI_491]